MVSKRRRFFKTGASDVLSDPSRIFNADESLMSGSKWSVRSKRIQKFEVKKGNEKAHNIVLSADGRLCPRVSLYQAT